MTYFGWDFRQRGLIFARKKRRISQLNKWLHWKKQNFGLNKRRYK